MDGSSPDEALDSRTTSAFEDRLRRAVTTDPPDVVHAGPLTDVAFTMIDIWQGPLIAMSWGFDLMDEVDRDEAARQRAQTVISRADQIIVDNNAPLRVALELGGPSKSIVQFPWGIDLRAYSPGMSTLREELGWNEQEVVILCTRRHEPVYDVATVVRGFIAASASSAELRLILAGSGSQSEELFELVRQGGMQHRVRFLGEVPQQSLPNVYRAADLYVSASRVDGSSVSLLEAMACGVAVCVTAIEGNAQWIAGDRGLSFACGDSAALSSRMIDAATDCAKNIVSKRITPALKFVRENADWKKNKYILARIADVAIASHRSRS